MVFNPEKDYPTEKHFTKEEAIEEAERISNKHDTEVFVLETIGIAKPPVVPSCYSEL